MEIREPPAYVKLSASPSRGEMVRIKAEELPYQYSRKILETISASLCFVRNEETEKTSPAKFLKKCELTVHQSEWHLENGKPTCTLSVEIEWKEGSGSSTQTDALYLTGIKHGRIKKPTGV